MNIYGFGKCSTGPIIDFIIRLYRKLSVFVMWTNPEMAWCQFLTTR